MSNLIGHSFGRSSPPPFNFFCAPIVFVPIIVAVGVVALVGCLKKDSGTTEVIPASTPSFTMTPPPTQTPSVANTPIATATATPKLDIGSTMTGSDGMTLLYVPAGEFTMGSDTGHNDERPVHTVYLDAFWIDQTEVTNGMYKTCVQSGKCAKPSSIDYYGFTNYPAVNVNWNDAAAYCSWAGRRLPTEAEWEKAARGTDGRTYPWGNEAPNDNLLNYDGHPTGDIAKVGSYPNGASPYGAYEMAGNVWEWANDWYGKTYYQDSPSSNPLGPESGEYRVIRGGSLNDAGSSVRVTYRNWNIPADEYHLSIGFRCATGTSLTFTPALPAETNTPVFTPITKPLPEEITDSKGIKMRLVPAGKFTMGENSGVHEVYLDAYYMDVYEVTNAAYKACVDDGECELPKAFKACPWDDEACELSRISVHYKDSTYADHPVVWVNWGQANVYCEWRSPSTRFASGQVRLPTEAEWEKAARGTDGRTYPWGEEPGCSKANTCKPDTTVVGSYESGKSPYGMFDMIGNVSEWVSDWYSETYYQNSPSSNPPGPDSGNSKVVRGGSWSNYRHQSGKSGWGPSIIIPASASARMWSNNGNSDNIGFRCASSP
jgi:formylglycine-generating enzyme required for sulfatase activity